MSSIYVLCVFIVSGRTTGNIQGRCQCHSCQFMNTGFMRPHIVQCEVSITSHVSIPSQYSTEVLTQRPR